MKIEKEKIPTFEYSRGSEFTEKLKEITECNTLLHMAKVFEMPKATFSTWNRHDRTSHELMVRLLLQNKISIDELPKLALTDDSLTKFYENQPSSTAEASEEISDSESGLYTIEQLQSCLYIKLKSFNLQDGKLIEEESIPYSTRRIVMLGFENANLIEIVTKDIIYLVDKTITDAMSGNYLICMDGRHSINSIQRLPRKLIAEFDGNKIELSDDEITILGKVVLTSHL